MREWRWIGRACVVVVGLLLLAAPGRADLVGSLATGDQMAGGTLYVTFSTAGVLSAPIVAGGPGQGMTVANAAFFTFSVTGDTFTHVWTLTNNTAVGAGGDTITSILFDLAGSISLFDNSPDSADTSTWGTPDSEKGRPGAVMCPTCSGPLWTAAAELVPWSNPINTGDMFVQERVTWGNNNFTAGQTVTWADDTDIWVIPEPATLLLAGSALLAVGFLRRRRLH